MHPKQFIFNIIINKLTLNDDRVTDIKNLLVKFKFDDIKFDITTSRINVTDFGEGRNVEFSSTLEDLRTKLKDTPFELTILQRKAVDELADKAQIESRPEKRDSEKSIRSKSESNNHGSDSVVGNKENEGSAAAIDGSSNISIKDIFVIGVVSCNWPASLLEKLNDDCTSMITHVQVCDIRHSEKVVGNISLGIILHCKCDVPLATASITSHGFLNEEGILRAFQNIQTEIDKNDVFFVVGKQFEQSTEEVPSKPSSEISPRWNTSKYDPRLDTSRYRLLRGTLVKDCKVFDKDKCRDHENYSVQRYKPPKDRTTVCQCCCCCCGLFDDHTRNSEMSLSSGRSSKLNLITESSSELDSDEDNEMRMQTPHRRKCKSAPKHLPTNPVLTTRFCPKCCQNLTFTAKNSPCSKCGYQLPAKRIHSPNETADDILGQWNSDEDYQSFPKIDHCTCYGPTDRKCLYCRIHQICNEVKECDPPSEMQNEPRPSCDLDKPDEVKLCDEILEKYGNDCDEKDKMELWKGKYERPNISKALYGRMKGLRGIPVSTDDKPKRFRKKLKNVPNRNQNKPIEELQSSELCPEERVRKIVDKLCKETPSETIPRKTKRKTIKEMIGKMLRKHRHRYCYPKPVAKTLGGHDYCIPGESLVPRSMGWLWNRDGAALKKGWRPGTINPSVRELMSYFLTDFPVDTLPTTQETAAWSRAPLEPEPEKELIQKPTIRIQKQNGQFLITMHPLMSEKELAVSANPYAKTDPIQFKIAKDPMALKRRLIKHYLKLVGFKKCDCRQPFYQCTCRSYAEKLRLLESLKDICDLLQVSDPHESLCLSDTDPTESESHLDMEFTPPAGIVKPHLRRKPDIAEITTQYDEMDYTNHTVRHEAIEKVRQYCAGPIVMEPCQLKAMQGKKGRLQKSSGI